MADRASAALAGLRLQWQSLRQQRRDRLQDVLRRWSAQLQDTVIAERHGRPVLAVKAGAVGHCKGMVHDSSASGNTVFVEPQAVIELGNRLAAQDGRIRDEEQRDLAELSTAEGEQHDPLTKLGEAAAVGSHLGEGPLWPVAGWRSAPFGGRPRCTICFGSAAAPPAGLAAEA